MRLVHPTRPSRRLAPTALGWLLAAVLVTLLALGSRAVQAQAGPPMILHVSESAGPGEVVGLRGANFGARPQVWLRRIDGSEGSAAALRPDVQADVLSSSDTYAAAQVPADQSPGLFAVWVRAGDRQSDPAWVNRARGTGFDADTIAAGQTLRIWGRNLTLSGGESKVTFVDRRGGPAKSASVVDGDATALTIKAPADLAPGTSYGVQVTNGFGGSWGTSEVDTPLVARAGGPDSWDLRVPWAADFTFAANRYDVTLDRRLAQHATGTGDANDRDALQAAIDAAAAAGGGVVYLPAGTYRVDAPSGSGLELRSNVVLQGDGAERTILQFGGRGPRAGTGSYALVWPNKTSTSGLADLAVKVVNGDSRYERNVRSLDGTRQLFLQRVRLDFDTEETGVVWKNSDRVLVSGSTIGASPQAQAPLHIENTTNFVVRDTDIHYLRKRIMVINSTNGVIERSRFTRDASLPLVGPGDSGGLDINFASNLTILDNVVETVNGPIASANDGESINSQGCNPPRQDFGTLTGAASNTLTDTSKTWQTIPTDYIVAIVDGVGTGQWRQITEGSGSTLSVSQPWDITPTRGSKYVVTKWSADAMLIKGNTLSGNPRGIWIYCGGHDLAIVNNSLTDAEGIWVRADQRQLMQDGSWYGRYNIAMDVLVEGNTVTNPALLRPSFISVNLLQISAEALHGTGIWGVQVRRNELGPGSDTPSNQYLENGFWNYVVYYPYPVRAGFRANPTPDADRAGIVGTIFEQNRVTGVDPAYRVGTGVRQTTILVPSAEVGRQRLQDDHGPGASRGAADTILVTSPEQATQPTPTGDQQRAGIGRGGER